MNKFLKTVNLTQISKNTFASGQYVHVGTKMNINKNVINTEYAVRGKVLLESMRIKEEMNSGKSFPFSSITECNIGNPQIFGQNPISFSREVLAATLCPSLIKDGKITNKDVIKRVEWYQSQIQGNIGAYSESFGYKFVRGSISKYIQERDGSKSATDINLISCLEGASSGVHIGINCMTSNPRDGIMIPIPQYPLYSACLSLYQASQVPYMLDEKLGWQISVEELQKSFKTARSNGVTPKVICVINPGNPTGQVLSKESIQEIIKFAVDNHLMIFADEVYQANIYSEKKQFHSFRKIRESLPPPYNQVELISFHTTSKGLIGECGLRGGYMEMLGVTNDLFEQILKIKSISLCSNTVGQLATELMVHPPVKGECSDATVELYNKETGDILSSLKKRAITVVNKLNKMQNVTCNEAEGAMYAFPQIKFSKKVIEEAARRGMPADLMYCLEVLNNTGIVMVPGSGFGQEEGTYHFRTTILVLPEENLFQRFEDLNKFNTQFHNQYK